ncbi:MAG: RHS repeat-associated core domain-containing protein [Pirellulales bacterium]|nr:RHS repeat-associated core domain-containing protein [Pirellulales bacterium]
MNEANEIETIDSSNANVAYDAAGNMIRTPSLADDWPGHYHLTYDAWNRLVMVRDATEYYLIADIEYDGLNRRIEKYYSVVGDEEFDSRAYYYNDRWQVVEEHALNSDEVLILDSQYVWSPRYIDALILRDRDTNEDYQFDERLYALSDANFNVTALVDENGDVVERYVYDAYGNATVLEPNFSVDANNTSDYAWTTLYTGRSLDGESGLMYYRNRYYHTGLGGFVTRDPIGYRGKSLNLFGFLDSSPLSSVDPMGTVTVECFCKCTYVFGFYHPKFIETVEVQATGIVVRQCAKACEALSTTGEKICYDEDDIYCVYSGWKMKGGGVQPPDPIFIGTGKYWSCVRKGILVEAKMGACIGALLASGLAIPAACAETFGIACAAAISAGVGGSIICCDDAATAIYDYANDCIRLG